MSQSPSSSKYLKFGFAITIIVLALSYLAYTGVKESQSYYVTIKNCATWAMALTPNICAFPAL